MDIKSFYKKNLITILKKIICGLRSTPERKIGLFRKMLLRIGLSALIPLMIVIAISVEESYRFVSNESLRSANGISNMYAGRISAELSMKLDEVRAFARVCESFRLIPSHSRRFVISSAARSVLEKNYNVLSVWTLWEPGAIEDDIFQYRNTRLSMSNGAFSAFWYRANGSIVQGALTPDVYREVFYEEPKRILSEVMRSASHSSYPGIFDEEVILTSICVPIIVNKTFVGVAGFDIDIAEYLRIIEDVTIFKSGYAVLLDNHGICISHPLPGKIGTVIGDDISLEAQRELIAKIRSGGIFTFDKISLKSGETSRLFFSPIKMGNNSNSWYLVIIIPVKEINASAVRLVGLLFLIGLIAVAVLFSSIYLVSKNISRPLLTLMVNTEKIAAGNYNVCIDNDRQDEIGRLADSFNRMVVKLQKSMRDYHDANTALIERNEALRKAEESLRELNADLENKVTERTCELNNAVSGLQESNAELEQVLVNFTKAQDQIVASEKMALLGQLIANIAHELNTPLGAIRSSVKCIIQANAKLYSDIISFVVNLSDHERAFFMMISLRGRDHASFIGAPLERNEKRLIARRLKKAEIIEHEMLADDIDTLGIYDLEEDVIRFARMNRSDIIHSAAILTESVRASAIILNAADKAAGTVSALVNYSRKDEYETPMVVDPVQEIEMLLILYFNKTKFGVEIRRDYQCRKKVEGYRDRLNQVWVNILNNSLQAMDYQGKLEIATRLKDDSIMILFTDSGPGIPENIKQKIFEPFFTTKKYGEGTGLGLDICRKIVKRHNGSIEFESEPGKTTFTVTLKIKKEVEAEL
jgi:signal transduction histidine kinase/HAMP domain-containing protein